MQICSFSVKKKKMKALAIQDPNPYSPGRVAISLYFSSWSQVSPFLTQPTCLNV